MNEILPILSLNPIPSDMSRISFSCPEVVEIIFSLTTAVKIDSKVQELVTMKNTKALVEKARRNSRPQVFLFNFS